MGKLKPVRRDRSAEKLEENKAAKTDVEKKSFCWDIVSQVFVAWESLAMFQLQNTGNGGGDSNLPQLAQLRRRERSFLGKGCNHAAGDCQTISAVPAKSLATELQLCLFVCP